MTDMIDGPMLVGIAALITSLVNSIIALRPPGRPSGNPRAPRIPRRRKGREDRRLRA